MQDAIYNCSMGSMKENGVRGSYFGPEMTSEFTFF